MCGKYSDSEHRERSPSSNGYFRSCGKGHWTAANIFAMVLGFMIFPPLGLIVLVWTIAGHPIQTMPGAIRDKWREFTGGERHRGVDSDNVVFNEYQQTQYDRIRELKEEIRNRAQRFKTFRADARRRADQHEFERFMSENSGNHSH